MENEIKEQTVETQQEQQEEFDVEKAVAEFDVTRTARKEALDQIEKMLNKASGGWNIDKKEQLKCWRNFFALSMMQEMLLRGLMSDLVGIIRSMAKGEIDVFNLTAKLFTVSQALYAKKLVTQEEMEKIYQEVTVPQLMARMTENQEEAVSEEPKND